MTSAAEVDQLVATAGRFLTTAWSYDTVRPLGPATTREIRDAWRGAAELGWAWVAHAEPPASPFAQAPALCALFTAVGRHPAPIPAASLAVALPLLAAAAPEPLAEHLDGTRLLAYAAGAGRDRWGDVRLADGRVSGELPGVAAAAAADSFVVAADGDRPALVLVEAASDGVRVEPLRSYDRLEAPGRVRLAAADAQVLLAGADAERVRAQIELLGRAATVAELAGLAAAALDLSVRYAGQRVQFGRAIGSFQAVKHLLAEAAIDGYALESTAATLARELAGSARPENEQRENSGALRADADRALAFAVDAAVRVVETALQVHGGIGFTLDYRLSWYFNRVMSRTGAHGSPRLARQALGRARLAGSVTS